MSPARGEEAAKSASLICGCPPASEQDSPGGQAAEAESAVSPESAPRRKICLYLIT